MPDKNIPINWHVGGPDRTWACGHLVNHLAGALPDFAHRLDPAADAAGLRVLMLVPQLARLGTDPGTILHLDGNRWMGKAVGSPAGRPPSMTVLFLVFELDRWSFGQLGGELIPYLGPGLAARAHDFYAVRRTRQIPAPSPDIILAQNVTQLRWLTTHLSKTIVRLGGNMSFDQQPQGHVDALLSDMGRCAAVIATNYHLYQIAAAVNPHTYLIPNGIDLARWHPREAGADPIPAGRRRVVFNRLKSPRPSRDPRRRMVAGFVGNVGTPAKAEYKGYGITREACVRLGVRFREALYGDRQIPHDQMAERFYHRIDCLIHPTLGEGCSNTLMEALACGVPVITTPTAGFHGELMTHGVDVLFCERTADSIAEQLALLADDPARAAAIGAAGREFALQHHDIRLVADQYRVVFRDVAERLGIPFDKGGLL